MDEKREGKIVRSMSGTYDVLSQGNLFSCRARGKFRKSGISPQVGDYVIYSMEGGTGYLWEILPRKNFFIRPSVANIDCLGIVASEAIPSTDPFLIDRVAAMAFVQDVSVVLVLNKCDLAPCDHLRSIYEGIGIPVIPTCATTGEGLDKLRNVIAGKTIVLTGNSGVGKTTILNHIVPDANMQTGEISRKLGRGRHTTRHSEMFLLDDGTCIIDTPGFSSFDSEIMDLRQKEQLYKAFPEFDPYLGCCRFDDCAHGKEPDCAVTAALRRGEIHPSRYGSYLKLLEIVKEYAAWKK